MAGISPRGAETPLVLAVVILTTGARPEELKQLQTSIEAARAVDKIVVWNSDVKQPKALCQGWRMLLPGQNLGVPGGRDLAIRDTAADVVVVLDDDACSETPELLAAVSERFSANPNLGALGFRIVESGKHTSLARWVPSHRNGHAATFPGGAHALRRSAYLEVGGYCNAFEFKHEETYLSWVLLDSGWDVQYASDLVVSHPATAESRHGNVDMQGIRNKIWLLRGFVPLWLWPLSFPPNVLQWLRRSRHDRSAVVAGVRSGWSSLPFERKPLRVGTIATLIHRGRFPR